VSDANRCTLAILMTLDALDQLLAGVCCFLLFGCTQDPSAIKGSGNSPRHVFERKLISPFSLYPGEKMFARSTWGRIDSPRLNVPDQSGGSFTPA